MNSGESIRINFRINKEVMEILEKVTTLEKVPNKSRFIRDAITYYWKIKELHRENKSQPQENKSQPQENKGQRQRNEEPKIISVVVQEQDEKEIRKKENTYNGTWSPPWIKR